MNYRLGKWYPSKDRVRADFGEFWKGILIKGGRTGIIFNYTGARRVHYGDSFDPSEGIIYYVGEGKIGNQTLNSRNQRLCELRQTEGLVDVFLDCGDIFRPKNLLYAGKWRVAEYGYEQVEGRRVYLFTLKPSKDEIVEFLKFTFFDTEHQKFEAALTEFAEHRAALYADFPEVLRVRDNVVGEIGEYFAVKALNNHERNQVIRLSSGIKNVDAIQIKNGLTYAVKTIGKIPQTTSNIWASRPEEAVDFFVIVLIDHNTLVPQCVLKISARKAAKYFKKDNYQGANKLAVTTDFVKEATVIYGDRPK